MTARASRHVLWLVLAAVPLLGADLGVRVLMNNDEARFPVLAQDMLARGDWLFPQINGAVYYNKPVFLGWLIALFSWPIGHVTQLTAALPSALGALATVLLVYALGRTLFTADAGRFAALVALTTQGVFLHARLAMPDMLMTCFMTASLWMGWRMVRGRPGPSWIGFYGFAGVGFWLKGPSGLLPLGVMLVWAIVRRPGDAVRLLRLAPGLPVFAAVIAPWWLLNLHADRAAVGRVVVFDQLLWYLPGVPSLSAVVDPLRNGFGIAFPWIFVVPVVVVAAVRFLRGQGTEREGVFFLLVWAVVVFAFVGVSSQQRFRYYLPLVPPVSLLIGWWTSGVVVKRRRVERIPWAAYGAIGAALAVASAAVLLFSGSWKKEMDISFPGSVPEALGLLAAVTIIGAALLHGVLSNQLARTFAIAWVASALLLVGGYHRELSRRNAAFDYPRVYERLRPVLAGRALVAAWGVPELPLTFYSNRPVAAVDSAAALARALDRGEPAVAIVTDRVLGELGHLTVLTRDRLALRAVSVVGGAPRGAGSDG